MKGIYDDRSSLLEQLSLDVQQSLNLGDLLPLTVYSRLDAVQINPTSMDHLRFLFYQLFIHEFCLNSTTTLTKDSFVDYFRSYYSENRRLLKKLNRFDEEYKSTTNILQWFESKCFLRRIFTQSLLKVNIPILFSMRFFISDMFKSMNNQENRFNTKYPNSFNGSSRFSYNKTNNDELVYHAQSLSKDTFTKIKSNIGKYRNH